MCIYMYVYICIYTCCLSCWVHNMLHLVSHTKCIHSYCLLVLIDRGIFRNRNELLTLLGVVSPLYRGDTKGKKPL